MNTKIRKKKEHGYSNRYSVIKTNTPPETALKPNTLFELETELEIVVFFVVFSPKKFRNLGNVFVTVTVITNSTGLTLPKCTLP